MKGMFNNGKGKQAKNADSSSGDRRELGKQLLADMTMNMESEDYRRVELDSEIVANGVGGKRENDEYRARPWNFHPPRGLRKCRLQAENF